MGFFDSFKSMFQTEQPKEENTNIKIPQQALQEFQQSTEGQLKLIEAQLFRVEEVYPVGAMEITDRIAQIREKMEKNLLQNVIDDMLNELQEMVATYTKKANQRYSIDQLKRAIVRVQKINFTATEEIEFTKRNELEGRLKSEEQYIASLSNRIADFQGQERDNLIATLMEARYRVAMGKMLLADGYWRRQEASVFFKNVPEVEKVLYGKFLMEDINELLRRYNIHYAEVERLLEIANQIKEDYPEATLEELKSKRAIDSIDARTNKIKDEFYNDLMDDFQITGLFGKKNFMISFAETCLELNAIEQSIEADKRNLEVQRQKLKQEQEEKEQARIAEEQRKAEEAKALEQEQARRKALEEKCKTMTNQEIQAEIAKIDSEVFDLKEKYKRIVEFQLAIAKARGLIGTKEIMDGEDIAFISCITSELPTMVDRLNQNTIFNTVMMGVDDDRNTSIIMIPKSDEERAKEVWSSREQTEEYRKRNEETFIGKLNETILKLLPRDKRGYFVIKNKEQNVYSVYEYSVEYKKECKRLMTELYQQVKQQDNNEEIKQNIKFYIQLPLQRSMLSIIQQLKQEGIEFYIPSVNIPNFDFKKSQPTYRIYIDRKYLERYRETVHPKISTANGVVIIGDEKVKISELMLQGCEFPYGIDKEIER